MGDHVVDVSPTEFKVQLQLDTEEVLSLRMTNVTSSAVAFSVKTTAPQRYMVMPVQGMLGAGEVKVCRLVLNRMSELPDAGNPKKLKDKFRVQSVAVPADRVDGLDLKGFWKLLEKDPDAGFQITKVTVRLVLPPAAAVPEEGEEEAAAADAGADEAGAAAAAAEAAAAAAADEEKAAAEELSRRQEKEEQEEKAAAEAAAAVRQEEEEAREAEEAEAKAQAEADARRRQEDEKKQKEAEAEAAAAARAEEVEKTAAAAAAQAAAAPAVSEEELAELRAAGAKYTQMADEAARVTEELVKANADLERERKQAAALADELKAARSDAENKASEIRDLERSLKEKEQVVRQRGAAAAAAGPGSPGSEALAQAVAKDSQAIRLTSAQLVVLCLVFLVAGFFIRT